MTGVQTCALSDLSGTSAVIRRLEALTGQGATLILADCCSSEDLSTIAEAALHFGRRCISVGSAGLAGRLAELFGKNPKQKELHSGCRTVQDGALMVVVGTRHPATVAQVQRLKAEEPMDTYLLTVEGISQENVPQRVCLSEAAVTYIASRISEDNLLKKS